MMTRSTQSCRRRLTVLRRNVNCKLKCIRRPSSFCSWSRITRRGPTSSASNSKLSIRESIKYRRKSSTKTIIVLGRSRRGFRRLRRACKLISRRWRDASATSRNTLTSRTQWAIKTSKSATRNFAKLLNSTSISKSSNKVSRKTRDSKNFRKLSSSRQPRIRSNKLIDYRRGKTNLTTGSIKSLPLRSIWTTKSSRQWRNRCKN